MGRMFAESGSDYAGVERKLKRFKMFNKFKRVQEVFEAMEK